MSLGGRAGYDCGESDSGVVEGDRGEINGYFAWWKSGGRANQRRLMGRCLNFVIISEDANGKSTHVL